MKFTFRYTYILARDDVSWKSVKQSIKTSSTMTTKFLICYEASNHEIQMQNFCHETAYSELKTTNAVFGNHDFIWKFGIGSNLLFSKSKNFKLGFRLNSTIAFKVVIVENLRMTTQTLSF